jgi:hypothetical protein
VDQIENHIGKDPPPRRRYLVPGVLAVLGFAAVLTAGVVFADVGDDGADARSQPAAGSSTPKGDVADTYGRQLVDEGRETFRNDTFASEGFFGGVLELHDAVQGEQHGGFGPGVSPETALAVGLKVDRLCLGISVDSPENHTQACRLEFIMFGGSEFRP